MFFHTWGIFLPAVSAARGLVSGNPAAAAYNGSVTFYNDSVTFRLEGTGLGIAGSGIDIVEVARVAAAAERHGGRFLTRVFTAAEAEYCRSRGVPAQHLAGRFAVKEAVLKALKTGWGDGILWREVEVSRGPAGEPNVELSGAAARRAGKMGIVRIHVSLSHTREHAIAHAIAETAE